MFQRLQPHSLAKLFTVGLFILLCVQLTQWALQWFAQPKISLPVQNQMARVEPLPSGALRSLFGGSSQSGRSSNVQLKGVVSVGDGAAGAAIVSVDGKAPEAVQVGKEIATGLKLVAVHAKSIVVERNGVREEVRLPAPTPSSAGGNPNVAANPNPLQAQTLSNNAATTGQANVVNPTPALPLPASGTGVMLPLDGNNGVPMKSPPVARQ